MKLHHESPRAEIVRLSTLTLETGGSGPPKLQLLDVISPIMTGVNGVKAAEPDAASPPRRSTGVPYLGGTPPGSESNFRARTTSNGTFSNTPQPPDSPMLPRFISVGSLPESAAADGSQSPQWSSAVGRATTGKSGRVIERLQAENDRLKRDLKLEILRREEEQRKGELARAKMESLQTSNDNLVQMREGDRMSLARRERKIEDLRAELGSEKTRRVEVEGQLSAVMEEGERVEQTLRAQAREDAERARRATNQYEVLSSSWRQLDDGYRRKTDKLKKEFMTMTKEGAEDRQQLKKLNTLVDQQKKALLQMQNTKDELARQLEAFKRETDDGIRAMREVAEANEKANEKALGDTLTVLGQMKHVINVKKYVRDAE